MPVDYPTDLEMLAAALSTIGLVEPRDALVVDEHSVAGACVFYDPAVGVSDEAGVESRNAEVADDQTYAQ